MLLAEELVFAVERVMNLVAAEDVGDCFRHMETLFGDRLKEKQLLQDHKFPLIL